MNSAVSLQSHRAEVLLEIRWAGGMAQYSGSHSLPAGGLLAVICLKPCLDHGSRPVMLVWILKLLIPTRQVIAPHPLRMLSER